MSTGSVAAVALAGLALAAGCSQRPQFKAIDGIPATEFRHLVTGGGGGASRPPSTAAGVSVTYLGTGGFLLERGDDTVIIAPFLSNHGFLRLGFWRLASDGVLIRRVLDPHRAALERARYLLVGHGHYDHLLDVPFVVETYRLRAVVIGSPGVCNTLSARGLATLAPQVEREPGNTGAWIPAAQPAGGQGHVRVMAIASGHAPNWKGMTVADGTVDRPLKHLPRKAGGLELGEPLAYMIDFLDPVTGAVDFRVYYQDAAEPPSPGHTLARNAAAPARRIDLAILCVASFEELGVPYPQTCRRVLDAREYLLAHWENFFRPWSREVGSLRAVPQTDPRVFVAELEGAGGANWILPTPDTTIDY